MIVRPLIKLACLGLVVFCFWSQSPGWCAVLSNAEHATLALPMLVAPRRAPRRRKRHLAWEEADHATGGIYMRNVETIARKFPTLTPMELRVAAMVKAMLPSWRIAELLAIDERTVDNYRVKIRRKTGCCHEGLSTRLTRI